MTSTEKDTDLFYPANRKEWRAWLKKHHDQKQSVWLVFYKQKSGMATISWSDAVDEALCFGWIDSKKKPVDEEKYIQFFSKRKAKGTWSKINKQKIEQLIAEGLMMPAGFASIEAAKQNGSWLILDNVEELEIPADLELAFSVHPGSGDFFLNLSRSVKKSILQWLVLAKRPETRQKRIAEVVELAVQKRKPKQF